MKEKDVKEAHNTALKALLEITDLDALEEWRVTKLGRSGPIISLLKYIKEVDPVERPSFGASVNRAKKELQEAFDEAHDALRSRAIESEMAGDQIDVSLPGTHPPRGGLHPLTRIMRRALQIYADMGFQVYLSRIVETDAYNFELLNTPKHHPARDMQDTFYVTDEVLLRTHTSPGQIRAMHEYAPEPLRIVVPGVVFRNEKVTARSELQFNQIEGLVVGRNITMGDLKGTIENFVHRMYGQDRAVRFRASYFPFTEPSGEVDVSCNLCEGRGCKVCKYNGWLEIMGCGMVHPRVLENGGYDPSEFTGFAFGGGLERVALLRYDIDDIRHFWANDLRFLEQMR